MKSLYKLIIKELKKAKIMIKKTINLIKKGGKQEKTYLLYKRVQINIGIIKF